MASFKRSTTKVNDDGYLFSCKQSECIDKYSRHNFTIFIWDLKAAARNSKQCYS